MESPRLVVVFWGLVASGKSYLAQAWAARHGCYYLNTDVVRKTMAGVAPTSRQKASPDRGLYTEEMSRQTYQALLQSTIERLKHSSTRCVVLDGSYQRRRERQRLQAGLPPGVLLRFVFCHCSEQVTRERLAVRQSDPEAVSDGSWEIYQRQLSSFELPSELTGHQLLSLDTESRLTELLNQVDLYIAGP